MKELELQEDMSESTLTAPPPIEPPEPTPVATEDVPEPERPKIWNQNAQKWVDAETGE